ncbi:hypothetical protein [Propionivibrio sp.]|uniref:hypothetical protein n=2 Tax=Propionivibrio sp. TaxID=2212460 RepID=UPI0025D00F2D|nr:hypothetical protein [Propionivibrio sp.]MBK8399765.1 hypothetical protein [Propionivibrio sp.]MBK8894638.1 hypothetical protein [Propionivibrio sp.]
MIPHEPRRLGYYANKNWFQRAVLLVIIGLFVVGLLSVLDETKQRTEEQMVSLTVRNMRTGLQLAMGDALMHQREHEMASWVGSNPVRWLNTIPEGYRGECSGDQRRNLAAGEWCFERDRRELVYQPRHVDQLRVLPEGSTAQCEQLSWRVARAPKAAASGGFVGLRIESASACHWVQVGR